MISKFEKNFNQGGKEGERVERKERLESRK
jgi:hypothetical protein